ncbi:MAG TPA: DinB family protein [Bryobacteraceae bacterium]|nr:DinB family protein [Bryobacteraceae bacterium]
MEAKRFQELYRYNRWANNRALDAAASLPEELFLKPMGSSFPSVRDTLAHILWAEWIWLCRWHGDSPAAAMAQEEFPTAESLRIRWQPIAEEQQLFLAGLSDEALSRPLSYTRSNGNRFEQPLWQVFQHVVNHSTHHRGQVATLLRQLGLKPPELDLVLYYRERITAQR